MSPRSRSKTSELSRRDAKLVGRSEPAVSLEIVSANGSRVRDAHGRTYIDFEMGWCVGNLGWNHPEIRARLAAFDGPSYVLPSMVYRPWVELAAKLADVAPGKLARSFRATGGTEAVEIAMQIARAYTGRETILAIEDDYHGNSTAVKDIDKKLSLPLDERALARLERALAHRRVAALIMEPIIMNLAVEMPTPAFMSGASELCAKYGTLFIADEVASGFGRTGAMFACEHFDLEPDILCVAKALTSGHAPMGAAITTARIADAVPEDLELYSTYGWHPLACEAALATLDLWRDRGDEILANVAEQSARFIARLDSMKLAEEIEVRVKGLAIGVDLPDENADEIVERCRENGLLISGEEDSLSLFPALTIDAATADAGLDILEQCLTS
jgi:4-aminobutyrate aminotransferase-like enzyme